MILVPTGVQAGGGGEGVGRDGGWTWNEGTPGGTPRRPLLGIWP
jgi:hypothetical protein